MKIQRFSSYQHHHRLIGMVFFLLLCLQMNTTSFAQKRTVTLKIVETSDVHGCFFPHNFINNSDMARFTRTCEHFLQTVERSVSEKHTAAWQRWHSARAADQLLFKFRRYPTAQHCGWCRQLSWVWRRDGWQSWYRDSTFLLWQMGCRTALPSARS